MRSLVLLILSAAFLLPGSAHAAERLTLWRTPDVRLDLHETRGLRFRVDEPDLRFRVGGRFHGDALIARDDRTSIGNDAGVRRGRVYLAGRGYDVWSFKAEYEFASDGAVDRKRGWRNAWVRYRPTRRSSIRAGNFVAPFGLQESTSSNHVVFLERSVASALAPSFGTGLEYRHRGRLGDERRQNHWTFATALLTEPFSDADRDRHKSEYWASSTRFTLAPLAFNRRVIHFGGSFAYRDLDGRSRYRIRTRPEASLAPALLNTGRLRDVEAAWSAGAEAAAVWGPVSLQGEYLRTRLERRGRADPVFDGWYLQGAVFLTGESRRYSRSRGVFRGVEPDGPWGAWEVALRYGVLDLNDESVTGGHGRNWSVGLNWYLRENLRFAFNYVGVNAREFQNLRSDDPHLFLFRVMTFF